MKKIGVILKIVGIYLAVFHLVLALMLWVSMVSYDKLMEKAFYQCGTTHLIYRGSAIIALFVAGICNIIKISGIILKNIGSKTEFRNK